MANANTYWNNNGTHNTLVAKLALLIPSQGEVANKAKNAKLEKFRKAQNCYYDLYNNGLCNRAREFASTFKIPAKQYGSYGHGYSPVLYTKLETAMDEIILAAAKEQNLVA